MEKTTETIEYLPIKKEFRSKGFHYLQIQREKDGAIYEQTSKTGKKTYEVIEIHRHDGYSIAGQKFPPAEMYPSNSQWGGIAWTCQTKEAAEAKLKWVVERMEEREKKKESKTEDKEKGGAG